MREERLSSFREPHATRRSHEQGRSQLVFQPPDLAAHGGLGDVELLSSSADVPLFGHGDEVLDLGEAHEGECTSKGLARQPGARSDPVNGARRR